MMIPTNPIAPTEGMELAVQNSFSLHDYFQFLLCSAADPIIPADRQHYSVSSHPCFSRITFSGVQARISLRQNAMPANRSFPLKAQALCSFYGTHVLRIRKPLNSAVSNARSLAIGREVQAVLDEQASGVREDVRPLEVGEHDYVSEFNGEVGNGRVDERDGAREAPAAADDLRERLARARLVVDREEDVARDFLESDLEERRNIFERVRGGERKVMEELWISGYLLEEGRGVKLGNERRKFDALVLEGGKIERDGAVNVVRLRRVATCFNLNDGRGVVVAPHFTGMDFSEMGGLKIELGFSKRYKCAVK